MTTIATRLRAAYYASQAYHRRLRKHPYEGRRGVPPDPVGGNESDGRAVINGDFRLLERLIHLGDVPWNAPQVEAGERERLHRFFFLDDLRAVDTPEARAKARDLVMRWITAHGHWALPAWRSDVLGARLAAWLRAVTFTTENFEQQIADSMEDSIRVQAAHLGRAIGDADTDSPTFDAAEGLLSAGVTLRGFETLIDDGISVLAQALDRHVLADGGHAVRNPAVQLSVLQSLLRVHAVLQAGQVPMPARLVSAIETTVPALRAQILGDGRFSRVGGAPEGDAARIKRTLKASGIRTRPVAGLPRTGVQRLECGNLIAVMDTGAAVDAARAPGGHAGVFAFEMSHKKRRIIVNCGSHPDPRNPWHETLRTTAAHSTVIIDDTNAVPLGPDAPALPEAFRDIVVRRNEHEGSRFVQAVHGGYLPSFALRISRELYVSAAGDDLRGRDAISFDTALLNGPRAPEPAEAVAVRFHIHPDVTVTRSGDGSFYLRAAADSIWRFRCAGADAALEDSVYLSDDGAVRKTRQIVLLTRLTPDPTTVKWSVRLEKTG